MSAQNIRPFFRRYKTIMFFGLKAVFLYVLWIIQDQIDLLERTGINQMVIQNLIYSSEFIINIFGYETFSEFDIIGIVDSSGVQIGAPCNALDLMALFTAVSILLPGKLGAKLLFLFLGNLLIHVLNVVRVVALIILVRFYPSLVEFNHNYTFTLIMYVIIFGFWVLWVRKFVNLQHAFEKS